MPHVSPFCIRITGYTFGSRPSPDDHRATARCFIKGVGEVRRTPTITTTPSERARDRANLQAAACKSLRTARAITKSARADQSAAMALRQARIAELHAALDAGTIPSSVARRELRALLA